MRRARGGATDLFAWKRMLAELPFDDPRRGQCVARVHELRAALAGEGVRR